MGVKPLPALDSPTPPVIEKRSSASKPKKEHVCLCLFFSGRGRVSKFRNEVLVYAKSMVLDVYAGSELKESSFRAVVLAS